MEYAKSKAWPGAIFVPLAGAVMMPSDPVCLETMTGAGEATAQAMSMPVVKVACISFKKENMADIN